MASKDRKNPLQQGYDWLSQNMNPMDAFDAFSGYFSPGAPAPVMTPGPVGPAPMMTPMAPPGVPPVDVMGALQGQPLVPPNMTPVPGLGAMEQLANMMPGMMMATPLMMTLPGLIGHLATGGTPARLREAERFGKMAKDGVAPSEDWGRYQQKAREDLAPDFVGTDAEGNRVNNKFYNSRNEQDLQGEDLVGRSSLYDLYGNLSKEQATRIGQAALDSGQVRENKGRMDVNMITPQMEAAANEMGVSLRAKAPKRQKGIFNMGPQGQAITKKNVDALAQSLGVDRKELIRNLGPGGLRPMDDIEGYISENKFNEKFDEQSFRRQQARQKNFWNELMKKQGGDKSSDSEPYSSQSGATEFNGNKGRMPKVDSRSVSAQPGMSTRKPGFIPGFNSSAPRDRNNIDPGMEMNDAQAERIRKLLEGEKKKNQNEQLKSFLSKRGVG